jgi:integrase
MRQKEQLVRIWARPSRTGKSYTCYLRYTDLDGKRKCESLGHGDWKKAEKQRAKKEKELRMGYCDPESIKLKDFMTDSLKRTGDQIRESTRDEYEKSFKDFINVIGNRDIQQITLSNGEYYRQACLDRGNSPATVRKKLTEIKAMFDLGVKRKQIDENPLEYIKKPKAPEANINIYTEHECEQILKVAHDYTQQSNFQKRICWDLVILTALSTALRRGELLNCIWEDIDFDQQVIRVRPKKNTETTWEWEIKTSNRRTLPLTDELTHLLIKHQNRQREGIPYVFVPSDRYNYIQTELRAKGRWKYSDSRLKVTSNFRREFKIIMARARVKKGTFHDFRRTAICNWFRQGMSEFDVMKAAGHTNFSTTHKFYLKVADNIVDKTRKATPRGLGQMLVGLEAGK